MVGSRLITHFPEIQGVKRSDFPSGFAKSGVVQGGAIARRTWAVTMVVQGITGGAGPGGWCGICVGLKQVLSPSSGRNPFHVFFHCFAPKGVFS